jgi:hypothetical protein
VCPILLQRSLLGPHHPRRLRSGPSAHRPSTPSVFIDEAAHLDQLHRCLDDDTIDIDLRAGGALILLYGINTTRVLALRQNQIQTKGGVTYLTLRDHDMLLPPKLADLLKQLPRPTRRSTLPEAPAPDRLLFPGRTPDRPVDNGGFGKRLKRSGLTIRGGRNTGLIGLAAALPAAVVAGSARHRYRYSDTLGRICQTRLERLLAARHADAQQQAGGTVTVTALVRQQPQPPTPRTHHDPRSAQRRRHLRPH